MIDSSIRDEAKKFAGFWNEVLKNHPDLKLDGTWPSIGIVDKILFPLRAKERFDKTDTDFIKGAAAYIGVFAYSCWSAYPDVTCELNKVGDGVEDYLLKAKGGKHLQDNEEFNILLCRTIEVALKSANKSIPYFADDSRYFTFEDNIISSIASGIVSGLCPNGQGKWAKLNQKQFESNLIICAKVMSESTVKYYGNRYSGEVHGSDLKLYYPHLALPPAKYNEPHIGARATAALTNYCIANKLSLPETKVLAKNLCLSSDEILSTSGYLLSCCLSAVEPPEWLLYAANARGLTNPLLRPTLAFARQAHEKKDFLDELEKNDLDSAEIKLKSEYYLGFLPLLYLSDFNNLNQLPSTFLYFIAWSSAKKAHDILDTFHIFEKLTPNLALQQAFLRINCGMLKEAKDTIEIHFEDKIPEDKEQRFRYYEIMSILDNKRRIDLMEEAILTGTSDPIRFATVGNQLARHYLQTENYEQAVILTEKITEVCPWWISAHLSKLIGLLALKREEQVEFILAELSPYYAISNNLFSYLKAKYLSKVTKK